MSEADLHATAKGRRVANPESTKANGPGAQPRTRAVQNDLAERSPPSRRIYHGTAVATFGWPYRAAFKDRFACVASAVRGGALRDGKAVVTTTNGRGGTGRTLPSASANCKTVSYGEQVQNYTEYLNSQHWIEFRERYKRIRDWRCATPECGQTEELDLHHLTYERVGKERLDDVVPLCRYHHVLAHLENMIFGAELSKAHLTLEMQKDISVRDALAAEILHELGAYDEKNEGIFLDLALTKEYRRSVVIVSDIGVNEYELGSHPQAVLTGCLQAIKENRPSEAEGFIALAEIEGGYI